MENNVATVAKVIETVSFGYDLEDIGIGDYNYAAHNYPIIHISTHFIDAIGDEKEAFERYTGFDQCHNLYYECEADDAFGVEKTQKDLDEQERFLAYEREGHYPMCSTCRRSKHTRYQKENPEQ